MSIFPIRLDSENELDSDGVAAEIVRQHRESLDALVDIAARCGPRALTGLDGVTRWVWDPVAGYPGAESTARHECYRIAARKLGIL